MGSAKAVLSIFLVRNIDARRRVAPRCDVTSDRGPMPYSFAVFSRYDDVTRRRRVRSLFTLRGPKWRRRTFCRFSHVAFRLPPVAGSRDRPSAENGKKRKVGG